MILATHLESFSKEDGRWRGLTSGGFLTLGRQWHLFQPLYTSKVAQVFLPNMAGLYHGLLKDSGGQVVGAITGFTLKNTRSFTTKLIFNGITYSLAGALLADGSFSGEIKRASKAALVVMLQLGSTPGGGLTLQGTVSGDGTTGGGLVAHSPFTKTQPVPGALVKSYTFLVPSTVTGNALLPEGDGYGSAKLTALGTITAAGKTGDGVAFTFGGFLTQDRQWHLFQPLYSSKGQLAGMLTFRDVPSVSDLDGTLRWLKPNAVPVTKSYAAGFDTTRGVVGSRYLPPLAGQRAFSPLANRFYNSWLRMSGPDMSTQPALNLLTMDRATTWTSANTLLYYGPDKITLTFSAATGLLTGTCVDVTRGVNLTFGGALLQKQGLVTGRYQAGAQTGLMMMQAR